MEGSSWGSNSNAGSNWASNSNNGVNPSGSTVINGGSWSSWNSNSGNGLGNGGSSTGGSSAFTENSGMNSGSSSSGWSGNNGMAGTSGTSGSSGSSWNSGSSGSSGTWNTNSGNSGASGSSGAMSGSGSSSGGGMSWNGGSSSGGSTTGLNTVSGTGDGNSWFNWVSTSTTNEGASSASGVNCGCGNLVKDECFFPDTSSCNHFYHCHNITAYHKRCPSNLYWNDATKLCDWPRNVVCNVPSGNSASGNSNGMTGGSGMMHMGRMIHSESELSVDVPAAPASPSANAAGCEGDECPEVTSEGLGGIFLNVHPTFKCDKGVNEKKRDPQACGRFIQCMDGLAYHFACQKNLHWSSELNVCADKSVAKCGSGEEMPKADVASNNEDKESASCPAGFTGLLPDESNCRRYISCSENGGFYMKC